MSAHSEVGVCAPQQLAPNHVPRPSFDHHHGIRKFFFGGSFMETIFRKPKKKARYSHPLEVDFIQGCFMFFRKTVFEEVRGFDPNIFLYYEEMDICTRLQNNRHKVIYNPNIDFYHIHEASTSVSIKTTGAKKVQILYSYLYVLYKNHSLIKFLIIKTHCFFPISWKVHFDPKLGSFSKHYSNTTITKRANFFGLKDWKHISIFSFEPDQGLEINLDEILPLNKFSGYKKK